MKEHIWRLIEAIKDSYGDIQCTYENETGDAYVHFVDGCLAYSDLHSCCWKGCSGDWPGCKSSCLLFHEVANQLREERRKYEFVPPYDPFGFMLNHTAEIDDFNCYVENFDTLDGAHWVISLDIGQQLMDLLDEEAAENDMEEIDPAYSEE